MGGQGYIGYGPDGELRLVRDLDKILDFPFASTSASTFPSSPPSNESSSLSIWEGFRDDWVFDSPASKLSSFPTVATPTTRSPFNSRGRDVFLFEGDCPCYQALPPPSSLGVGYSNTVGSASPPFNDYSESSLLSGDYKAQPERPLICLNESKMKNHRSRLRGTRKEIKRNRNKVGLKLPSGSFTLFLKVRGSCGSVVEFSFRHSHTVCSSAGVVLSLFVHGTSLRVLASPYSSERAFLVFTAAER